MIAFENTEVVGWEAAIRGMRNSWDSWEKSDSLFGRDLAIPYTQNNPIILIDSNGDETYIGDSDLDLMKCLRNADTDHRKFMMMITVYVDITAPLYWWEEMDQYLVGQPTNLCSTMHKIADKEFEWTDFSVERLTNFGMWGKQFTDADASYAPAKVMGCVISALNGMRVRYLDYKSRGLEWSKEANQYWWQIIQLLPSSYNQKRTVMLNYEVLANIYKSRKNHKLDEWSEHEEIIPSIDSTSQAKYSKPYIELFGFCDWLKTLPYFELITGEAG